jgi:protein TonB
VITAPDRRRRGFRAAPFSLAVHGLALLAVVVVPLLAPEPLPEPSGGIHAFLVGPPALAAPPPPPPPPAPGTAVARRTTPSPEAASNRLLAPVEVPESIAEEQGLDLGFEGGVPGGVEGGVPGGVVGGVIGGLPEGPPPEVRPVRVGSQVKEPLKLRHVDPVYPYLASRTRLHGVVVLECVISAEGRVTRVELLRGVPILNEAAVEAVKQWVYRPTLLNGVPTPVIMTVTVTFNLADTL